MSARDETAAKLHKALVSAMGAPLLPLPAATAQYLAEHLADALVPSWLHERKARTAGEEIAHVLLMVGLVPADWLHAFRAEVLAEHTAEGEAYPGELAMLRGFLGVVRVIAKHSDIDELRRVVHEYETDKQAARTEAREKSSPTGADATPELTDRQARLLDATRTHGGTWTTRRVLALYALTDPDIVQRGAARRDLTALCRAGHLVLVDEPDNRHYTRNTRHGGDR
ncbi:hypothetical protein [Streptomyces sp. NPDC002573]|uniref:hypothetical protein n=1 Tax=Streptomyces sp. NPDC002573 TaxID=3364651 RepID=UPI0036B96937